MAVPRPQKIGVISPAGRRDTRIVGALRLASAVATGGAIVAAGSLLDGKSDGAAAAAIAFALLAGAFAFAELAYGGRAARAEERRIRASILRRQYAAAVDPHSQHERFPPAKVIQLMTDNTERVTEYRQVYFGSTLAAMVIPFVALLYIGVFIDPVVGFVVLALVPLIPLAIRGFMKFLRRTSSRSRRQRADLSSRYLDAIRNLVTIRLHGAGARIESELRVEGERNRGAIMKLLAGNQIVIVVMDGIFSLVLICATAGLLVARADHVGPGEALTVMLLTVLTLEPLQQVAGFFYIGMGGMASQKAIGAYLESTAEGAVVGGSTPAAGAAKFDDTGRPAADLGIAMRGVRFDYGRGEVLHGVDLDVPAGSRVAIVGRSGAGKSTLVGLLRGSLAPQQGAISVAGHGVEAADGAATRALSAVVGQSTWMFTGTIADNLRIARADATEDEMWEALRGAHVAEEVERMPHGIDTDLGEGAALISGGQAQRISLARALLSGRRVLLLDEPTSQVDIESEAAIIAAIEALPRDRTVLMITHRSSLLRAADAVYELDGGELSPLEAGRV